MNSGSYEFRQKQRRQQNAEETTNFTPAGAGSSKNEKDEMAIPQSICRGDISLPQQIFASSIGALLTSLVVTPMDVVKIRLQSQVRPLAEGECFLFSNGLMDHLCHVCKQRVENGKNGTAAAAGKTMPSLELMKNRKIGGNGPTNGKMLQCEWFNRPGHFNGTMDAFVKIARKEGIRSLWSGLSPTMLSAIPATVFYFTLYDNLHCALRDRIGPNRLFVPLTAGSLARAVAVTVVSPLELIRTKMQSERLSHRELKSAIQRTIKSDGYGALWRGWTATIFRDIPFSAIYWTFYELAKERSILAFGADRTNFSISFLCGAFAGSIAAILTLPADVVKTHQQITLGEIEGRKRPPPPTNGGLPGGKGAAANSQGGGGTLFQIGRELVRTKGMSALFTGIVPRVARVAPACAIMIGCYEHFKLFFARKNHDKNFAK